MFQPNYHISPQLLDSIKRIAVLGHELNRRRISDIVYAELLSEAMVTSTYASTSIEGNPLPLTEVKRLLNQKVRDIAFRPIQRPRAQIPRRRTVVRDRHTPHQMQIFFRFWSAGYAAPNTSDHDTPLGACWILY
jgi:hypothetical protein